MIYFNTNRVGVHIVRTYFTGVILFTCSILRINESDFCLLSR